MVSYGYRLICSMVNTTMYLMIFDII